MAKFPALLTKNINDLLGQRKFTQAQLCVLTKINASQINKYFSGKTVPSIEILELIAEKSEIPIIDFFMTEEERLGAVSNVDTSSQSTIATLMETVNNLNKRIRELEEKILAIEGKNSSAAIQSKPNITGLNKP